MMDTATAARAVHGRMLGANVRFARVTTDTRSLAPGDLFVAVKGERFDGHDFVGAAFDRGAAAALVADARASGLTGNLVVVADTLGALGELAAHWRARFAIPVVAVAGSNGKTTVKEMLAAILRAHFGAPRVLATEGNLNNAIGVPLTLLRLRAGHEVAAIEVGMNHPGETALLAAIAQPTVAVVNNAQREHQEFMKSVADVAVEHAALVRALPPTAPRCSMPTIRTSASGALPHTRASACSTSRSITWPRSAHGTRCRRPAVRWSCRRRPVTRPCSLRCPAATTRRTHSPRRRQRSRSGFRSAPWPTASRHSGPSLAVWPRGAPSRARR